MAGRIAYYGNIVTNGLILDLDAAKRDSYPGAGTVWSDISGNQFTGSLVNGPTFSSANGGTLNFFSASSQFVTGSDLGNLPRFTIDTWFNLTTTLSGTPAIITNTYTTILNFSVGVNNRAGNICVGFYDTNWRTTTGFTPVTNTWYNVIGTYDGTTIVQYLNGSSQSTTSYSGTPSSSGAGFRIARRWDLGDYINGQIPSVKIYNRALSASEVLQNYNALKGRYGL